MVKQSQVHEVGEGCFPRTRPSCLKPRNGGTVKNKTVSLQGWGHDMSTPRPTPAGRGHTQVTEFFSIKSSGPGGGANSCLGCLSHSQPWTRLGCGREREALGHGVAALHPSSQATQLPLAARARAIRGSVFPAQALSSRSLQTPNRCFFCSQPGRAVVEAPG